jgi:hypothetical protein
VRAENCVVSYGGADLPVTPLPTLMSLCLIESSAGVFIPQSFMSISKVSDLKLCSAIRPHYYFGLLFFLVVHLGGCQSRHTVEAHNGKQRVAEQKCGEQAARAKGYK